MGIREVGECGRKLVYLGGISAISALCDISHSCFLRDILLSVHRRNKYCLQLETGNRRCGEPVLQSPTWCLQCSKLCKKRDIKVRGSGGMLCLQRGPPPPWCSVVWPAKSFSGSALLIRSDFSCENLPPVPLSLSFSLSGSRPYYLNKLSSQTEKASHGPLSWKQRHGSLAKGCPARIGSASGRSVL